MSAVSLLIAGDYSPKERFQCLIDNDQYVDIFPGLESLFSSVDYSVVNFESTISSRESVPISKIGSHLSTSENSLAPLKLLGVNMLTLANNHILDYGEDALNNTMDVVSKHGFDVVGVGKNIKEARIPKIINIRHKNIAIINACEHEFSIATNYTGGANPFDLINIVYDIKYAKSIADYVIVIVHGGIEHYQLPSPRMKKIYRFLIDQGADVVCNHHQHCYSGYEVYKEKPIFYGLGNFCFDSEMDRRLRQSTYNYGYMVKILLSSEISFEIIPYEQFNDIPGIYILDGDRHGKFMQKLNYLNTIIKDDEKLEGEFQKIAFRNRDYLYSAFRPYMNRICNKLYYLGLIPSFLSKKRLRVIKSFVDCESHYELLLENLRRE